MTNLLDSSAVPVPFPEGAYRILPPLPSTEGADRILRKLRLLLRLVEEGEKC